LTAGVEGGLNTLTFTGGGYVASEGTIGYYIFVYLPGDWTTSGTGTGDYTFNGVGPDFSTPTFTYSGGITTVESFATAYNSDTGDVTNLSFTLFGAPVPEPAAWAMMLLGIGGVGAAMRIATRKNAIALSAA
ncbi:MAG TPA: PEPxxWA-CTERM sorting domain-containing protein, partial [Caulobacteraceae bacterium]|nr:PEPxxWA-CTERM sorting domain-containing protein [Caulobacteraceae bacterium]